MNEIKPVFSDDQHANAEEVLRSLARLLGRQAARELAEAEQVDLSPPLNKNEGVGNDQP
jgi:hypothetical protein